MCSVTSGAYFDHLVKAASARFNHGEVTVLFKINNLIRGAFEII